MAIKALLNNPNKDPNIGIVEKVAYGLGDFASQLVLTTVSMLFIYYATEYVNVNISVVAAIMMISRIFDGLSDLTVGYLLEKTNSQYGRTRVWILRMIIPYFITGVAMFSVPHDMPDIAKYIYIFIVYNLCITVVFTSINLPYGALSTVMTQDSYKRSVLVIFRMLGSTAGVTVVMMCTLPMVHYFGNDPTAWTITAAILSGVASVAFFLTFFFCHERVESAQHNKEQKEKGNTLRAIGRIFKNKNWVMLTIAMLMVCAADIVSGSANTYYCRYFLNNDTLIGNFSAVNNICKVAGMILILPFVLKRFGKRNSLLFACILMIFAGGLRVVDPYSVELNYALQALAGFACGFTYTCLFAMIPDCVEYSEYLDHERHEGLVYSSVSFASKLAGGLGIVISSVTMDFGGYINGAATQSDGAMNAIFYSVAIIPPVMFLIAILAIAFYNLDKIYDKVIAELQDRRLANIRNESSTTES